MTDTGTMIPMIEIQMKLIVDMVATMQLVTKLATWILSLIMLQMFQVWKLLLQDGQKRHSQSVSS